MFAASKPAFVVPAGREAWAIELVAVPGYERPLPGGVVLDRIELKSDRGVYGVRPAGTADTADSLCTVEFTPAAAAAPGAHIAGDRAATVTVLTPHAGAEAACRQAEASILAHPRPGFFQPAAPQPGSDAAMGALGFAIVALVGWAALLAAWLTWRRAWSAVRMRFQATHLLPAVLQTAIFAWWGWHAPEVVDHLPMLAGQIAFAYAFDFLCGMTLRRRWDLTFGPLPVVGSANLFVWFASGAQALAFAVIALGLAAKWGIRRGADGRLTRSVAASGAHVFNPSALGIAVVGATCLALPTWGRFEDIAHRLAEPPHMLAVLTAVTAVALVRVPVVLVTLGAALALLALKYAGAWHVVYPFWPAVFLAITLLATDPATIPRTGSGRLAFGIATGLGIWAASAALTVLGQQDFFGKVFAIPFVNWFAPRFDNWSRRCGSWARFLEPRWNLAHVAGWLSLAAGFQYL